MVPYYPSGQTPLTLNKTIRVERELPAPGWMLVESGGRVEPGDVIGRTSVPRLVATVDVASRLKIPPQRAFELLTKPAGTRLQKGEVFASTKGMFRRRTCQAPIDGILTSFDRRTGFAKFVDSPVEFTLASQLPAKIAAIQDSRRVTLEMMGTRLFGIVGVGDEQRGELRVISRDGDILPDMIDASCAGCILLGRTGIGGEALRLAANNGVRGVIVGSTSIYTLQAFLGLTPDELRSLDLRTWHFPPLPPERSIPLTLVVTEAIGRVAMPPTKFEMLSSLEGKEVAVRGTTKLRDGLTRPEVIIAGTLEEEEEPEVLEAETWQGPLVWMNTAPLLGLEGHVSRLYDEPQRLEAGNLARAAAVELTDGREITVPLVDTELGEST